MRRTPVFTLILGCLALACDSKPSSVEDSERAPHAARDSADSTTPSVRSLAATDTQAARPATAAELSQPTLASAMHDGQCSSQADCGANNVCMAVMPGVAECVPARFAGAAAMEAAPNGRPAPPVGLLDGQVLRDQVMRDQPIPVGQP